MPDTTIDFADQMALATYANVGDVVTLKAGGPRMTVMYVGPVGIKSGDWLFCQWFDEQGELCEDVFTRDMVQIEPRSIPAASMKFRLPLGRASASRA